MGSGGCCAFFLVLVWLIFNAGDAVWIYFYVRARVVPRDPHNAVNKTSSSLDAYRDMMFIFGFFLSSVNSTIWGAFMSAVGEGGAGCLLTILFSPLLFLLIVMPFCGGWILVPLARLHEWNHRCDKFPMYAILDGKGFDDPGYVANVVHFYQTPSQSPMFTYVIAQTDGSGDFWDFKLREWDQLQGILPLQLYPTLQQISYNFINSSFTGNCTTANSVNGTTTTNSCSHGTFMLNNIFSFNISSNVPLNSTAVAHTNTTVTHLRAADNQWAISNEPPSLILETVNRTSNELQSSSGIVRTVVVKKGDCTQLKVCLQGVNNQVAGPVGAETLAPLGIMMLQQANYAFQCTAPGATNVDEPPDVFDLGNGSQDEGGDEEGD